MEQYIIQAKRKAGSIEKYAVNNGVVCGRYINGKLILMIALHIDFVIVKDNKRALLEKLKMTERKIEKDFNEYCS